MTSNRFFFKFQKEMFQRYLVLPLLSGIGFFLCLPFAALMMMSDRSSNEVFVYAGIQLLSKNAFLQLAMFAMATFAGILIFGYLHHRKQVDFFHALPIRRTKLFTQLYLAGILGVLPIYLVMYVITAIIIRIVGVVPEFNFVNLASAAINNIAFFILFYSMSVLACVITGNRFIALVMCGIFHVALPGTAGLLNSLCYCWFATYDGSRGLESFKVAFPLYRYFSSNLAAVQYQYGMLFRDAAATLAVGVVLAILAAVLFKVRKSEMASSALAFNWMKTPLKCYLVVMSGYCFMQLLLLFGTNSWIYPGIVIGVVISHLVLEGVFHFDIRAIFSHWKTMLALTAASFAFYAIMDADLIGFDKKIPAQDQIQSVVVDSFYRDYNTWSNGSSIRVITDMDQPESISTALQMAEYAVTHQNGEAGEMETTHLRVTYTFKNGSQMRRAYWTIPNTQEYRQMMDTLRFSKEFLQKKDDSPSQIDLKDEENLELFVSDYTQLKYAKVTDAKKGKEIFAALQRDALKMNRERAKTELPVFNLELRYGLDTQATDSQKAYYFYNQFPVYAGYSETLSLLSKYCGLTPYDYTAQDIREISIMLHDYGYGEEVNFSNTYADSQYYNEESNTITITDKQHIEALLQNAILLSVAEDADPLFPLERDEGIDIQITFNNGTTDHLLYRVGTNKADYIQQLWKQYMNPTVTQ